MQTQDLTKKIRQLDIITSKNVTELFAGNYKSSFRGLGLEVDNIRHYEEGDDTRHIDWITTAKQAEPYIKQYKETRELTTIIMLDLSASMNFTSSEKFKKEAALETASILLFSALKSGDKFGAILFSDQVEIYIPPRKGRSHLLRILREIIVRYDDNSYKKSNYKNALDFLNKAIKKHPICFLISDGMSENVSHLLRIANKKNDLVFINVYDHFERGIDTPGIVRVEDPETGEQTVIDLADSKMRQDFKQRRAQKARTLRNLMKKNRIDFLEISTTSNIYKELLLFFKKRQAQR